MCARTLLLAKLFTSPVFATSFVSDLAHTSVYFGVSRFDRNTICGRFDRIDGAVNFNEATHQGGFNFTVDTDSISTRLRVLDGVLKSEQSLGAAKSSVIRLRSNRFVVEGGRLIATEADLTLHGMTQLTRLEARRFSCGDKKMSGSTRHVYGDDLHLAAARSAFGMARPLPNVGDRVDLDISVEAIPQ